MITLFKCLVTAKKSFMSNKRLLNAKISPGHQVYKVIHTHHMDNFKQARNQKVTRQQNMHGHVLYVGI